MSQVATKPLRYENLQRAKEMLDKNNPAPPPQITLMSQKDFNFTMLCAKHYRGKQIIKRNHRAVKKKNRYKRTFTVPYMAILSEDCLMHYGVRFMPVPTFSQSHQ